MTYVSGQCQVDLDALTGKFPPLLTQKGEFVFPSSRTEDDKRILTFGEIFFHNQLMIFMILEEDAPLDLFCHGSEKGQPSTFVNISGVDTGESKVALTCVGEVFKRLLFEVMPIIACCFLYIPYICRLPCLLSQPPATVSRNHC